MENKWVPYPMKTLLGTGRNIKWRQALAPLSLFSFATSACSHIFTVEDISVHDALHAPQHCLNFSRAHPHAPLLHFYKWALSVAAAVSHPRHAEWDATARDIIKVSPEHVGGGGSVSSSHRLSFTNTNRCFLMRSHANLLTSAVVFNTVRVKQCLQRWRS